MSGFSNGATEIISRQWSPLLVVVDMEGDFLRNSLNRRSICVTLGSYGVTMS
jgi:hypothetical protein